MKLVYRFNDLIKIYRYNLKNKFINVKNFHYIKLNDATMVLCENNKRILFIKEYRLGLKKMSWGLPGGFIEKNETPKKAALREAREETGVKLKKVKLFKKFCRNGNYHCGTDYVFFSRVKNNKCKLETNVRHQWLNKQEIKKYLQKNKFETPGVISAAFYYLSKIN